MSIDWTWGSIIWYEDCGGGGGGASGGGGVAADSTGI